jgi:hypothetical protein
VTLGHEMTVALLDLQLLNKPYTSRIRSKDCYCWAWVHRQRERGEEPEEVRVWQVVFIGQCLSSCICLRDIKKLTFILLQKKRWYFRISQNK